MEKQVKITQRQAKILAAIVKEHCDTGVPVASKELGDKYDFGLSAATIRNEMQALEKSGFITHPHTSSGRVPTDEGYRYFINQLMERVKLSVKEQEKLRGEVLKLQMINAEVGRRLAKVLAGHSAQASFAVFPEEVSSTGLANILDNSQLPAEDAKEIAEFFDHLDEHAQNLMDEYGDKAAQVFVGKELTLSKKSDYSMVVSGLMLPSGKRGVIGLVGPKSMKYQKNLSLLEYITKLISAGGAAVLLFMIIR